MPIPSTHLEEKLSISYVTAIVSKAGAQLNNSPGVEYGTDMVIQRVRYIPNIGYVNDGIFIPCQIKSTKNWSMNDDNSINYDMEVNAYNKIVISEGIPTLLILLRLPVDQNDWLTQDEECLNLKNCCYWENLNGNQSTNSSSVRVKIPRDHLFTPEIVVSMLNNINSTELRQS